MRERILEIIEYATNGNKARFAEKCGWKPQYLQNILKGSIGLEPVIRLLETLPEVNARWLILGEGAMLDPLVSKRQTLKLLADELAKIEGKIREFL